jgi:hypothetical protein
MRRQCRFDIPADNVRKAVSDAQSGGRKTVLMRVKSAQGTRFVAVPDHLGLIGRASQPRGCWSPHSRRDKEAGALAGVLPALWSAPEALLVVATAEALTIIGPAETAPTTGQTETLAAIGRAETAEPERSL